MGVCGAPANPGRCDNEGNNGNNGQNNPCDLGGQRHCWGWVGGTFGFCCARWCSVWALVVGAIGALMRYGDLGHIRGILGVSVILGRRDRRGSPGLFVCILVCAQGSLSRGVV